MYLLCLSIIYFTIRCRRISSSFLKIQDLFCGMLNLDRDGVVDVCPRQFCGRFHGKTGSQRQEDADEEEAKTETSDLGRDAKSAIDELLRSVVMVIDQSAGEGPGILSRQDSHTRYPPNDVVSQTVV